MAPLRKVATPDPSLQSAEPWSGGKDDPVPRSAPVSENPILQLQRRGASNQAVAKALQPAPTAPAPQSRVGVAGPERSNTSWAEQTSAPNRRLGQEIDELDRLSNAELLERRSLVTLQASYLRDDRHSQYEQTFEAIEFLANSRGLAPLDWDSRWNVPANDEHRRDRAGWRLNLRTVIERGVRETGSLKASIEGMMHGKASEDDIAFFEKEADEFGKAFTRQAKDNALQMLLQSDIEIKRVAESYGLAGRHVDWAAGQIIAKDRDVGDVADELIRNTRIWSDTTPVQVKREDLAKIGKLLKRRQHVAKDRFWAWRRAEGSLVGDWHNQQKQLTLRTTEQQYQREERHLTRVWERAEMAHPLLASVRGPETRLEDVDLGALDAASAPPQMAAMLREVLPKAVAIRRVLYRLNLGPNTAGHLNPLSLPPVVAVTKAAMFVPEGSIRAGKINDLVDEAQDKTVSQYIAEGLLALIVLATVIPSGGSSLAIGIGVTSAALSATSAVEDWEHYKKQELLVNTALDRARALSTEEPSLAPVVLDLIFLGFDGAMLNSAFKEVVSLRNLVREGQSAKNTAEIKTIIGHLDDMGKARGAGADLGKSMYGRVGEIEKDAGSAVRAQPESPASRPAQPEADRPAAQSTQPPHRDVEVKANPDPAHGGADVESASPATTTTAEATPGSAPGAGATRDARIAHQRGVVDKRRINWADAQKQVAETNGRLTAANDAVGPARERVTAARAKAAAADRRVTTAQADLGETRWSGERAAAEERRNQAREAAKQATGELKAAQKQLDDVKASVKRLTKALEEHEDALTRTATDLERSETELGRITSRTGEEVPRLDSSVPLDQRQANFTVSEQRPRYAKSGNSLPTGRGRAGEIEGGVPVRIFQDPVSAASIKRTRAIMKLAESNPQKAGRLFADEIGHEMKWGSISERFTETHGEIGRRWDFGNTKEITIEGRAGAFGEGKLDQMWFDLNHHGLVDLTVPVLSEEAEAQLGRLAWEWQSWTGRTPSIFVRVVLP